MGLRAAGMCICTDSIGSPIETWCQALPNLLFRRPGSEDASINWYMISLFYQIVAQRTI